MKLGRGALVGVVLVACSSCGAEPDRTDPTPVVAGPMRDAAVDRPSDDDAFGAVPAVDAGTDADASSVTPIASRCAPPAGVSAAPTTIGEAVALMNALPRPTTLSCFIESLSRPLEVYFTKSQLSAQPADGEESPRTFIVNGSLFMSSVPGGFAQQTLELGFRTTSERAIRAEVVFPLRAPVTAATLADHIALTERFTFCSNCHVREAKVTDDFLGERAFESDVIEPDPDNEVPLEQVRALASSCESLDTSERCVRLRALFDHGALRTTQAFPRTP